MILIFVKVVDKNGIELVYFGSFSSTTFLLVSADAVTVNIA